MACQGLQIAHVGPIAQGVTTLWLLYVGKAIRHTSKSGLIIFSRPYMGALARQCA